MKSFEYTKFQLGRIFFSFSPKKPGSEYSNTLYTKTTKGMMLRIFLAWHTLLDVPVSSDIVQTVRVVGVGGVVARAAVVVVVD